MFFGPSPTSFIFSDLIKIKKIWNINLYHFQQLLFYTFQGVIRVKTYFGDPYYNLTLLAVTELEDSII